MKANTATAQPRPLHLRFGGTSVLIDLDSPSGPAMIHWGRPLDDEPATHAALALAARPQRVTGGLDTPSLAPILATTASGWFGFQSIEGHRDGTQFSLKFELVQVEDQSEQSARLVMRDAETNLDAVVELKIGGSGLIWQRVFLINRGATRYTLQSALLAFPLPESAVELLDTAGQWLTERTPQRLPFAIGGHLRESRKGRPGLDSPLLISAGERGFGFESGLVHSIHVAWSGGYRLLAERTVEASGRLLGGEHIAPGEVILEPGGNYLSPWVVGSWGNGLNQMSARFHGEMRARKGHPRRPRPITINTWEAVRFDLDPAKLIQLAETAAEVGIERFVLDDGWFKGRRNDGTGLGDWFVDSAVWPQGLRPLTDRLTELGLEFGLWIEPEMANADSDLAREHPDWLLRARSGLPPMARKQHVIDLTNPAAYAHILGRITALLGEYPIKYLKWDHNRDLIDAASDSGGSASYRAQVFALYRLLDEIRAAHPTLEIESCASGGGRVDLEILQRTERVWPSDNLEPLDRLGIQRYTKLLVPPELIGAHVTGTGYGVGELHALDLSAIAALLCHFGVEWDLTKVSESEKSRLKQWVAVAKRARDLVATGVHVDTDPGESSFDVRGVISIDGRKALFTVVRIRSSAAGSGSEYLRFPGLWPEKNYELSVLSETNVHGIGRTPLPWAQSTIRLSGSDLSTVGLRAPQLEPRSGFVIEFFAS